MFRKLSYLAVLFFALLNIFKANAVEFTYKNGNDVEDHYSIYYKCDSIDVNPSYLDNPKQIERIIHYIKNTTRIDSIVINAYASPEGGTRYNRWLSLERA